MDGPSTHGTGPTGPRFLLLFIALLLLLANGRMDSGDANAELQGALNLVRSGSFGTYQPYADPLIQSLFVRSPDGRYYESHDIGNSLLMLPSAWVAATASRRFPGLNLKGMAGTYSDSSLILAKTLCSLTATVFSAIACFFLFLVFQLFLGRRTSVALALLFPFGTYFAGYFRSCWDVVPACNALCILLYFLTTMFAAEKPQATTPMWAAFWCGITCLFRYSLLPFLGLSMALVFWKNRHRFRPSSYLWSAIIFAATLLPTLSFNLVRMGSLLKPGTMAPQFAAQNGLTSNIISGANGLLFSPNRGLFVFSPLLLLLLVLPLCWKALPAAIRAVLICLAPGVFFYLLLISGLRNWGAAGWGPRYLLPVFPVFFLAAGFVLTSMWNHNRAWRTAASLVTVLACAVALPAIMVNYTAAIGPDPMSIDTGAHTPRQILDTIDSFISSVQGRLAPTAELRAQEATVTFPDLAATRVFLLLQKKSEGMAIGFVVMYLLSIAFVLYALARRFNNRPGSSSPPARSTAR